VPKEAVTAMETALEQVHKSPTWKDLAKRNIFQDIYMGSAEFAKYLAVRYEEYKGFYDAIQLGKSK
jgi:tripartite-type tricarboxylate transporter receptor subunit TctC